MLGWFKRLLKSIEKANEDSFKGKKMDCCDLNKPSDGKNNKN